MATETAAFLFEFEDAMTRETVEKTMQPFLFSSDMARPAVTDPLVIAKQRLLEQDKWMMTIVRVQTDDFA